MTLAAPARAEIEVRRSRFVADLVPVGSEEEARAAIETVRASSREARHHCTAFVLGPSGAVARSNDDGEPSGTAGAPMLEVLRGREVTDVVAIVTRWFGGVLLGTGGLIRAYGDAVIAGLDSATLLTRDLTLRHEVAVGHADGPRVENALRSQPGCTVIAVDYLADGVRITVGTDPEGTESLQGSVAALTSGTARVRVTGEAWVDRG